MGGPEKCGGEQCGLVKGAFGVWPGNTLEHCQKFLLSSPPPVACGGYFLGHLPISPLPQQKQTQDLPPTPFNPSEKKKNKTQKPHSVLSLHASCPPSLFSLVLSFLKALYPKAKEYSFISLGSGTWVGCRVSSHCRGEVPPLSHPALTRAGSHIRGRPGEHARFTQRLQNGCKWTCV